MFGVFIGLQVANWNDERADRAAEDVILDRLETEFLYQEAELQLLIERLSLFKESARQVTMAFKAGAPPDDHEQFMSALDETPNLGRPPARSATYVQLLSSGDLELLTNNNLRDLLVRYDQNIERNGFMFDQTLALLLKTGDYFAATNSNFAEKEHTPNDRVRISEFDFDALTAAEGDVE